MRAQPRFPHVVYAHVLLRVIGTIGALVNKNLIRDQIVVFVEFNICCGT